MPNQLATKYPARAFLSARFFLVGKSLYYWLSAIPCVVGNRVTCPCCGHHLRRFVAFHGRSVLCPWCWSLPRHRLLAFYLQNCTNVFQDTLTLLHFAPDALERRFRANPNLTYISADLEDPRAMKRIDITSIPLADQSMDAILCSHVLEHVPDDRKAMRELYRILKPGGWAILLVPIDLERETTFEDPSVVDPKERLRLFGQSDHVRIYGRDYVTRLEQAGFVVRQDEYARTLDSSLIEKYGLASNDTIYFCTRPVALEESQPQLREELVPNFRDE